MIYFFVNQKFTIILAYTAVLLGYWQIDKSAKRYIMYVVWVKMHGIIYETNLYKDVYDDYLNF